MPWVVRVVEESTGQGFLTEAERQNNALLIYSQYYKIMTLEALCGILGNMDRESTLNPGLYDSASGGTNGLIGWHPPTNLISWCSQQGYDWYNGDAQCAFINIENSYQAGTPEAVWYSRNGYNYTWEQFKQLTNVEEATRAFERQREVSGDYPNNMQIRIDNANYWYNYLINEQPIQFKPRTSDEGMYGSPWWYSNGNVFYASGYGLPNCTCYAYGRYAEIQGNQYVFPQLPTGDAGTWYNSATNFRRGSTPELGAVICWGDSGTGRPGHVAIVEAIYSDGSILISNSGYNAFYFRTDILTPANNYCDGWIGSPYYDYHLQGFIYNDVITPIPPIPPTPPKPYPKRRKGMPVWMMLKYYT